MRYRKGIAVVSTSNDGIMTEYMITYFALRSEANDRPTELLKTLYMSDCYRAGKDLRSARDEYDAAIWNGISTAEIDARLKDLARFMASLARDRLSTWGVPH
ncbi:MAG: hypothetical protein ACXU82_06835 [Caulobacteraceae bacterium]